MNAPRVIPRFPALFFLTFVGAWIFLIFHLSHEWWTNPQYGFGFFVPFLCCWLLWNHREEILGAFKTAAPPAKCSPLAYAILFLSAFAFFPMELLRQISPELRSIGFLGVFACFLLTFWTLRQMGVRKVPVIIYGAACLFLTAVPWPSLLDVWITQGLMKKIAEITSEILNFMGVLAIPNGNLIDLGNGLVSIDEACSGVRSLQSCFMASVALCLFLNLSWARGLLLVVLGIFLALVGNLLRTLILTLMAARQGASVVKVFHDPAGWSILLIVTFLLYWIGRKWERLPAHSQKSSITFHPPLHCSGLPRMRLLIFIACLSIFGAHAWYWFNEYRYPPEKEAFLSLRKNAPGWYIQDITVPPAIMQELQPESGNYYQGNSPRWGGAGIYVFFWPTGSHSLVAFFHRPDICMTGIGWKMTHDVRQISVKIGNRDTQWYLFSFERGGERVLQAWGVWRDGVEQKLDFSRGWESLFFQHMQRWHYVWQGRREANTEILSVVVDATSKTDEMVAQIVRELFAEKERKLP